MNNDLPVKTKESFLAEAEVMDLSKLKDKTYLVAVATGNPDMVHFLASTVHGPYSFIEMVQEVGDMWLQHQHHAKVVILDKNAKNAVTALDANTIDYIECHGADIITEEMLNGMFDLDKEFTCQAGLTSDTDKPDPRL